MNADRRHLGHVCLALLVECNHIGEISDSSHTKLTEALKHMQAQEYWQLKNQERHEGKNASTDTQLAICRAALPALEAAAAALAEDDFTEVIRHLTTAITTDGSTPKKRRTTRGKAT
ncbi:hypothetical protein SEA_WILLIAMSTRONG_55 [Microbacterium phage WilliamStrong]|nr:hypothetical protein SEA_WILLIAMSTRONG_55 [Microbacterium phage WilliamStrong]